MTSASDNLSQFYFCNLFLEKNLGQQSSTGGICVTFSSLSPFFFQALKM